MTTHLKILVVDDEEPIRHVFKNYIESTTDHKVLTACDGLEALQIISENEIDCCFTDLSMPVLDGLELAQKIQTNDSTIPVVVMTGYPSMDNAIKTLKNGVADFLTKPVNMEQLPLTIEKVMRERALLLDNLLLKEEAKKNEKLRKINHELQEKIHDLETLNRLLQRLDEGSTSKDLFQILVNLSGEVTNCHEAHFHIFTQNLTNPVVISSFYKDESMCSVDMDEEKEEFLRKVAKDGIPFIVKGMNGTPGIMAIPLKVKSTVFGVLCTIKREGTRRFNEKDLYFLNFLIERSSFLIENLALYENIYENLFSTLFALVEAIEAKDPYTQQHSSRVTRYAVTIAEAMNRPQEDIDALNVSGNIHDIGKIGIPDKILLKPGRLTDEEYEVIKKHPIIGSNIIGHLGLWTNEQKVIRHHHERWDGNGYPDGLKEEEIPFLSRILSIADVYDALTSDRAYRKKLSDDVALSMIKRSAGDQFDPEIADLFIDLHEQGAFESNTLE
jgi:response regulator RpfG family c-di-GMP phosphodiesterase